MKHFYLQQSFPIYHKYNNYKCRYLKDESESESKETVAKP